VKQLLTLGGLVLVAALAVGACGSDDSSSSSSSSTTSRDAVCAARDDLEQSVSNLADPDVLTGGRSAIDDAADAVQDDLDALESAARQDLRPQVDAVKESFDDLKTAVGKVGDGKLSDDLADVGDAITNLSDATTDLYDSLESRCG
jgi:hypothetical protein